MVRVYAFQPGEIGWKDAQWTEYTRLTRLNKQKHIGNEKEVRCNDKVTPRNRGGEVFRSHFSEQWRVSKRCERADRQDGTSGGKCQL